MKQGEIFLIEFPFTDGSSVKKRPALVIGSIKGDNVILAQISTKRKRITDYRVLLRHLDVDGGLPVESYVYCDMIFTLHRKLVIKDMGKISVDKLKEVRDILNCVFLLAAKYE